MPQLTGLSANRTILTVSDVVQRIRVCLDAAIGEVWVAGEISNFRCPSSGHFYFVLKDSRSQLAAVMFRSSQRGLRFRPQDGMEVIVRARVSLYETRGDLQLYVESIEPRGVGAWQLALDQLKQKLLAEGLFDPARKRPLPIWPRAVGLITARTGAAVHDMITTLRRRMPFVRILLRPVRVQGHGSARELVLALRDMNDFPEVDVIVVGRGGGSAEDLWAFNDEALARAIANSPKPVVSAVGHETDVTIADLVADVRAATPTAAASLVVPDCRELVMHLRRTLRLLGVAMRSYVKSKRDRLHGLARRLRDPRQAIRVQRLRVDELAERAQRATESLLRLQRQKLEGVSEQLDALSPLAVLRRGYALVQQDASGAVVRSAIQLERGDLLRIRFAQGAARARVEEKTQ